MSEQNLPPRSQASTAAPGTEAKTQFPAAAPGTAVRVVWGNEHYQPAPYNGFDTGSFEVSGPVNPGESVAAAMHRLWLEADAVMQRVRAKKLADCIETLKKLAAAGGR